jgi:hypothetical protein
MKQQEKRKLWKIMGLIERTEREKLSQVMEILEYSGRFWFAALSASPANLGFKR